MIGKVVKSFAPVFQPRTTIDRSPGRRRWRQRSNVEVPGAYSRQLCRLPYQARSDFVCRRERGILWWRGDGAGVATRADPSIWFVTPNLTPARGSALSKFPIAIRSWRVLRRAASPPRVADAMGIVWADEP